MPRIKNTKSGVWTDPTIWDLGRVPQDGDKVTIKNNTRVTCPPDMTPIKGAAVEFEGMGAVLDTSRIKLTGVAMRGGSPSPVSRED